MSPMRRIAEAARRVPEVQDMTISDSPRDPTDVNIVEQETERRLESSQTIEEGIPSTVEQQTGVRDDTIREPRMVEEHVPLLMEDPLLLERNNIHHHKYHSHTNFCDYCNNSSQRVDVITFYTPSQFHWHRGRSISTWTHLPL